MGGISIAKRSLRVKKISQGGTPEKKALRKQQQTKNNNILRVGQKNKSLGRKDSFFSLVSTTSTEEVKSYSSLDHLIILIVGI